MSFRREQAIRLRLCKGNVGALHVLVALSHVGREDLYDIFEKEEIGGSDIWVLFKDLCGENIYTLTELVDDLVKAENQGRLKELVGR